MQVRVANHSSYPRVGDKPELQKLRRAIEEAAQGKKTPADLARAQEELTRLAIREQEEAGCDIVTDGLVRWHDGISHFAGNFEGVRLGSIFRFFDTNFLVRQPHVQSRIRWKGALTASEYSFAAKTANRTVKTVMTGPVTLARHTLLDTNAYTPASLAADYAAGLIEEAKALAAAGAGLVQVEEPSILTHPEDLSVLKEFLGALAQLKPKPSVILATYFNDAAPQYENLLALPVSGLAWDLTRSRTLADRISSGFSKTLVLGLADGRNTLLEKAEDLARLAEKLSAKARGEVQLSPSCGLEYLPRNKAQAKLALLAKTKKLLEG